MARRYCVPRSILRPNVRRRLVGAVGRRALAALLAALLILPLLASAALADVWSDIPDQQWQDDYGITAEQADAVADGFLDGTFKPYRDVTRGQFTKMSVDGLDIAKEDPATPSFSDVPRSHLFYQHIEGAAEIGLIGGYLDQTFRPGNPITRQQTNSILGRYLSNAEIASKGYIQVGNSFQYQSLEEWYTIEGPYWLTGFDDGGQVLEVHRPGTAYLIARDVVKGSAGRLNPGATLSRAQAVALVVRTGETVGDIGNPPPAPTDLATLPPSPSNVSRPFITGETIRHGQVAVYDTFDGAFSQVAEGTADSSGDFSVRVENPLMEGLHSFTVKVKDEDGFTSPSSAAIPYLLDLTAPQGEITVPSAGGATNVRKPVFQVTAADGDGAGVDTVTFAYRALGAPSFTTISVDGTPQAGLYEAAWGDIVLADGVYELQATLTDRAGNSKLVGPIEVTVDLHAPTVELEEPMAAGIFFTEEVQPLFLASADDAPPPATPGATPSGVSRVDFLYAFAADLPVDPGDWTAADFDLISSSVETETRAVWSGLTLDDGHYVFAVESTDRAGNGSGLDTQELVVDTASAEATITAPVAGARIAGGEPYTIAWTATDAYLPPDPITLEYSDDDGATWNEIVAGTANDGSFDWDVPSAGDDFDTFKIRLTVTDGLGPPTVVETGAFTVDNTDPAAPTAVVHTDNDANPGVDGRDFTVDWTPSTSTDVASQRVYILPLGVDLLVSGTEAHLPAATFPDNTTATWTGPAELTTDGAGDPFDLVTAYSVYVVAVDQAGRTGVSEPDTWALPDAPTDLEATDEDTTAGIDGRDFKLIWSNSVSADVAAQRIFILPTGETLVLVGTGAHTPATTIDDNTTGSWQGTDALTVDGAGASLAAGDYDLWVVAVDEDGRMRPSLPDTMTAVEP